MQTVSSRGTSDNTNGVNYWKHWSMQNEAKPYRLDYDWFKKNAPVWKRIFVNRDCMFKKFDLDVEKSPVRVLEIGSWEGSSTTWMMDNLLVHPDSRLICVDPFTGNSEHNTLGHNVRRAFDNLVHNIDVSGKKEQVKLIQKQSHEALTEMLPSMAESFDIVYVDGSHDEKMVMIDAVLGFMLLRQRGFIVFDDYTWALRYNRHGQVTPDTGCVAHSPRRAIDAFYNIYMDDLLHISKHADKSFIASGQQFFVKMNPVSQLLDRTDLLMR